MKAKEARATSTLRLILAALKDRDIAERTKGNDQGLGDEAILDMLQQMVRQRQESIEMYTRGGRSALAPREGEGIDVLQRFLPNQMVADAIRPPPAAPTGRPGPPRSK